MSCNCESPMRPPVEQPALPERSGVPLGRDTFAPLHIANLTNWWSVRPGRVWQERNGSRTTPASTANDPIGEIVQLYGSHSLTAAADSQRPILKKSIRSAGFDGSNDLMANASVGARGTSWTFAIAGYLGVRTGAYRVAAQLGPLTSGQACAFYWQPDGTFDLSVYGTVVTGVSAEESTRRVWIATYDGTTRKLYEDGVLVSSRAMTANLGAGFCLGSFSDGSYASACSIRDALVYSRPINGAERRVVTDYLKS
jgi:hypothetical protein